MEIRVITVGDKEPFIFTGKEAEKFNISFNFAMQKGADWMVYQHEEQGRHFNIRNIVSVLITKKD